MRKFLILLGILFFLAFQGQAAETTWRHSGFEIWGFDLNFSNNYSLNNVKWINGTNLNVSDVRQDLNFNNKNISQVELVNNVNFTDKIREPETYKIFNDSGTIKVLDSSGQLNYSGTNLSILLNNINTTMPANSTIEFYGGKYNLTGEVQFGQDVQLVCKGVCSIESNMPNAIQFNFSGQTITTLTLNADTIIGAAHFGVADSSAINPGDLAIIYDDVIWSVTNYPQWKTGEIHEVYQASLAARVSIMDTFIHNYTTAQNAKVVIISPITVSMKGRFRLDAGSPTANIQAIKLRHTKNSVVEGIECNNAGYTCIEVRESYNTAIRESVLMNTSQSGNGYGVVVSDATAYTKIKENRISLNRHAVSVGGNGGSNSGGYGQSREVYVEENKIDESNQINPSHAVDAHGITESFYVLRNTITSNAPVQYNVRSGAKLTVVEGNTFRSGFGYSPRGCILNQDIIIRDNIFDNSTYLYITNTTGNGVCDLINYLEVSDNFAKGTEVIGITANNVTNIKITDNYINDTDWKVGGDAMNINGVYQNTTGIIERNTVITPQRDCIRATNLSNVDIKDNKCYNINPRNVNAVYGFWLLNSSNNTVQDNYIELKVNSNNWGVLISGALSQNNTIIGNKLNISDRVSTISKNYSDIAKDNQGTNPYNYGNAAQVGNISIGAGDSYYNTTSQLQYFRNNTMFIPVNTMPICSQQVPNITGSQCLNMTSEPTPVFPQMNIWNGTRWTFMNGTGV